MGKGVEMVESNIELTPNLTAQALGSQITYYRRYQISAILSLMSDDDDGQKASAPQRKQTIDNARFEKALETIKQGTYSVHLLKSTFELSDLQEKALLIL